MKTIIQQDLSTTEIIIDRNYCHLDYQCLKFKYQFPKSNFYKPRNISFDLHNCIEYMGRDSIPIVLQSRCILELNQIL